MAFFNLAGLYAQAQAESGGNYTSQSPTSSASGAYQFLTPTWQEYQAQYNSIYGTNWNYPTAASAPPAIQDGVASITPVSNWGGSWAGSGGSIANNPLYTQTTALDVSGASGPIASGNQIATGPGDTSWGGPQGFNPDVPGVYGGTTPGSTLGGGEIIGGGTVDPTTGTLLSGYGMPEQIGLQPNLVTSVGSWVNQVQTAVGNWMTNATTTFFGQVQNWFARAGLIVLAIVLIAVALWRLMDPSGEKTSAALKMAAV